MKKIVSILVFLSFSIQAVAVEWGQWGKVQQIYVKTDAAAPFIQLEAGTMPGCYNNSGGYLHGNDVDKAYSAMMAAMLAGRKVKVLYEVNPNSDGWSMCYIKSLYFSNQG